MSTHPDGPETCQVNDEILQLRLELERLRHEGQRKREEYNAEIHQMVSQISNTQVELHKRGEEAQSHFKFGGYLKVIQQKQRASPADDQSVPTNDAYASASAVHPVSSSSTAIVHPMHFSLFSIVQYLEAHLLQKLHLAMMLKEQKRKQSKCWSRVIMFMFHRTRSDVGKRIRRASNYLNQSIHQNEAFQQRRRESYNKMNNLQKTIIDHLQEAEAIAFDRSPISEESKMIDHDDGVNFANDRCKRSSIKEIKTRKRELEENIRASISSSFRQSSKIDVSELRLTISSISAAYDECKEQEYLPERRSSIEDMKFKNRELESCVRSKLSPSESLSQ